MIDIGISKIALIGAVALVVIGPEKLPRVARMVGTLLGKAQRYVAEVKAEVNRSMALDELKKMRDSVEEAARDVQHSMQTQANELQATLTEAVDFSAQATPASEVPPQYKRPQKNWRLKQGAVPQWYKARTGVRTKALSGAARVARFRPPRAH